MFMSLWFSSGRVQYSNSIEAGICTPAEGRPLVIPERVEQRFTSLCRVTAPLFLSVIKNYHVCTEDVGSRSVICRTAGASYALLFPRHGTAKETSKGKSLRISQTKCKPSMSPVWLNNTGTLKHLHIHTRLKRYLVIQSLLMFS